MEPPVAAPVSVMVMMLVLVSAMVTMPVSVMVTMIVLLIVVAMELMPLSDLVGREVEFTKEVTPIESEDPLAEAVLDVELAKTVDS